jgi:hypothetical protein
MVMSEVSLSRIEELLFGITLELRPTLAIGDPIVLSIGWGHTSPCGRALGVPEWSAARY